MLLILNDLGCVWFTNTVLDGNFYKLGVDYIMADATPENSLINAKDSEFTRLETLARIFPLRAACTVEFKGTGGELDVWRFLCVLGPNVLSRYIFLILWFWYGALLICSFLNVCKIIGMIFNLSKVRASYLMGAVGSTKVSI